MKQSEFNFDGQPKAPPPPPKVSPERMKEVMEKIKKLLRLAADQRGNPHEAERALALAFELAEKHRVDVTSLDLDEEVAKIVFEHIHIGQRLDTLRKGILGLLQTYFHVTVCVQGARLLVIGKPEDILFATYVHDFLLRAGRACLATFTADEKRARRRMTPLKRAGYLQGFVYGLSSQLNRARTALALDDERTALVLAEEGARKAKLAAMVPDRAVVKSQSKKLNKSALEQGWIDGRKTQINQPLAGAAAEKLCLT